jgi:Odorant response abnormal 4-like
VSSKVYGLHRNTIADIETYIKNDIIKSITTRMQIYYDAFLANDDGGNENEAEYNREVNNTTPPKRVFFPIGMGNISLSDYLFSHETEETTVKQAFDILGIEIKKEDVDTNAESSQSIALEKILESATNNEKVSATAANDSTKMLLILAIIGLIIALIVSVALHQFLK